MDISAVDVPALRWLFSLGCIALLLSMEWAVPFRTPTQSRLEHVSTNLIIFGGNSLVAQFIAGWALLLWSGYVTSEGWGLLYYLPLDPVSHVIASIIMLDLAAYAMHRLYHRVPFLWRFHRAHHSDLDIDSTTSLRFHLGEVVMTSGMKGLSVLGLGVSPVGFLLSETVTLAAGLFSHGNVRLPGRLESRLRLAVVTPTMHWIHHSRRLAEHNTNLGAIFSGWDRLFGTYYMGVGRNEIQFGLDEYPAPEDVTLVRFARIPFDSACRRLEHDRTVTPSPVAAINANR
jgi:sterol desaturase/sphingolipid hydroxylase (fatty acid hydroxylase superfamily)